MPDTISAVATSGGISAIGIVRVSGSDAIAVADKLFHAKSGLRLRDAENRRAYYGELTGADGSLIDLCLCMISRAPDSYTGENTAEFHCHGSPVVLSEVLRELFALGVRQAQAGEFTKRAFLNGRMDLTQAEAVIDLIDAETPSAVHNAAGQLRGAVGLKLESVYSALLDITAHYHAFIDYPDEDVDDFDMNSYLTALRRAEGALSKMLATHERGRVLRSGVPTAIIGRPNTGKSSLLNALLGYNRAIVTSIAGTTRDTIEEKIVVGGVLLRLIDTAGLRNASDTIEKLGVERTLAALDAAGLAVLVLDGSEPMQKDDYEALNRIPRRIPTLIAVNKSDLPPVLDDEFLFSLGFPFCHVSALTGDGIEALGAEIGKLFPGFEKQPVGEIVTNTRQAEAIGNALSSVCQAIQATCASVTPDAVLCEIESALAAIGEATGKVLREDVVARIFERFCVGK